MHRTDDPERFNQNETAPLLAKKSCRSRIENYNGTSIKLAATSTKTSYLGLIRKYRSFRLYLISYLISQAGEWFTYVACIELMEQILGFKRSKSRLYISFLVMSRVLPNIIFTPVGGILADFYDRMNCLIYLDILSSICPFLFMAADVLESKTLIFLATIIQASLVTLYQPAWSSILPQMVDDDEFLKMATTLTGLAWSLMAAVGSSLGGVLLPIIGFRGCFLVDSISFLLSAYILWNIGGSWSVAGSQDQQLELSSEQSSSVITRSKSLIVNMYQMILDSIEYLRASSFGPLVLMKCTGASIYGACDVLNVSFSEEGLEMHHISNEEFKNESAKRLGILFFMVGMGCLFGPLVSDPFVSMKNTTTVMHACVFSFAFIAIGCLGMGYFKPFGAIAFYTMIRSAGSSVEWIYSSLLLQIYCKDEMLGRVSSFDYGLATTFEAISALLAGLLQDDLGMTAKEVSCVMSLIGFILFICWLRYSYEFGNGH